MHLCFIFKYHHLQAAIDALSNHSLELKEKEARIALLQRELQKARQASVYSNQQREKLVAQNIMVASTRENLTLVVKEAKKSSAKNLKVRT